MAVQLHRRDPFLAWVMRYMAWNHTVRGSLVESKMVPAVIEVWRWQRLHWELAAAQLAASVMATAGAQKPILFGF